MKKILLLMLLAFVYILPISAQEQDPTVITGNIIGVPKPFSNPAFLVGNLAGQLYWETITRSAFLDSIFSAAFTVTPIVTFTAVPVFSAGFSSTTQVIQCTDAVVADTNVISAGVTNVSVSATNQDATDFIVLPAITAVPIGHMITIIANSTSNFELRTVAGSNIKINNVDADGSQQYLVTDANTVFIHKVSNAYGWVAYDFDHVGAIVAAHVPN